jgi:hypothetical protein
MRTNLHHHRWNYLYQNLNYKTFNFLISFWGNSQFGPPICTLPSFWSLTEEKLQNSHWLSAPLVNLVQSVNFGRQVNKNADLAFFGHTSAWWGGMRDKNDSGGTRDQNDSGGTRDQKMTLEKNISQFN